ncbi:MAG: DUF2269 family protein, partial [Elusimicrobia bacterium]|nr:DUF2269 family protein [Elusimicrobiota bacterium]
MPRHASTRWIGLFMGLTMLSSLMAIPLGMGIRIPLPLPYNWHKWLHILGAILLLGNVIVSGFWVVRAYWAKDEPALRFAAKSVHWADAFFTAPGAFLILSNGLLLSQSWGGYWRTPWITISFAMFGFTGFLWVVKLIPIQERLVGWAEDPAPLPEAFYADVKRWNVYGTICTLLPLVATVLM